MPLLTTNNSEPWWRQSGLIPVVPSPRLIVWYPEPPLPGRATEIDVARPLEAEPLMFCTEAVGVETLKLYSLP